MILSQVPSIGSSVLLAGVSQKPMSPTDHFFGTHMGRQRLVKREDGQSRRNMAKLLIDLFDCGRTPI